MNRFQKVNFRSIEEFLEFLPENEFRVVMHLRSIIFNCLPNPIEKLSYNVPFYYQKSRLCFIWPSSVPWGNVDKDGVLLGFVNGNLMRDEQGYLEKGARKKVYGKAFYSIDEIDTDLVKTYIFEALEVDRLTK